MKAIVVRRTGGPDVLALEDSRVPEPGAGEVRIRVVMVGVNFTDGEGRQGLSPKTLPWIPGIEAAGVVDALGDGVAPSWRGRRVAATGRSTYAEAIVAGVGDLMPLPDGVTWEQAAACPIQGSTAYHMLHSAVRIRAGETVLVHAAAGGTGSWCVQLAVRAGARVFGACSTAAKVDAARAFGAEDAFVYGPDLAERIRARTGGRGVDVVLDSVGRDTQEASLAALAPFGRLIHFGTASGAPALVDVERLYDKSISVGAYWLLTPHRPAAVRAATATLLGGLADGSLRAPVTRVYTLAEAAAAHQALDSRASQGKLLLRVGEA
jgi:NADPH2:quinone reductase